MLLSLFLCCRKWAADRKVVDPTYFERLCAQQTPEYLWIGCADSRVPVSSVGLGLRCMSAWRLPFPPW